MRRDDAKLAELSQQITAAVQSMSHVEQARLNIEIAKLREQHHDQRRHVELLTKEMAAAAQCPMHRVGLFYHQNRPEDVYVCPFGPHFVFWTAVNGGFPRLVNLQSLASLPDLDAPMYPAKAAAK